ncbi:YciI family protein [Gordonia sp. LSe1-13]|uniref:YciI family protein n=1 Tax=Gordonia sesuvii TaxID=3116777 RepID=A0ABU7MIT3_9ACTN|nr:YciI family protein [Gordonia sp. LSe1-13]
MPFYSAVYDYYDNEETRRKRADLSDEHVAFIEDLLAREIILVATTWGAEDPPGGQIVIEADSTSEAREIIMADPNARSGCGVVTINEWRPVAGPLVETLAAQK